MIMMETYMYIEANILGVRRHFTATQLKTLKVLSLM